MPERENPNQTALQPSWRFGNGMFALVLSFGLLLTALRSRKARSWRYGTGTLLSIEVFGSKNEENFLNNGILNSSHLLLCNLNFFIELCWYISFHIVLFPVCVKKIRTVFF